MREEDVIEKLCILKDKNHKNGNIKNNNIIIMIMIIIVIIIILRIIIIFLSR